MAEEIYAGTRGECPRITKEASGLTYILILDRSKGKLWKPCFQCSETIIETKTGGQV
jgi:hypothetical protein